MHNYYTQNYNKTVFDLLRRHRGIGEAVLFARSATAGGQQYPVHWGGDCESSYEAMAETLRGGLSLAASGFAYWSHDIGGFEGTPDAGVFKRWLAFGLLSSHSRLHGSNSYRVPWAFDDEAVSVARRFTELKISLMPYLARVADEGPADGTPMLRPMNLEFPDDPAVGYLDTQYMLGDALLVAPVFRPDGTVRFYVPAGSWTSLLDGSVVTGPGWVQQSHPYDSLPVLVRPGTVLPVGARRDTPDYHYANGVALHVYGVDAVENQTVRIPGTGDLSDTTFSVDRRGEQLSIARSSGPSAAWSVVLSEGFQAGSINGGELDGSTITATGDVITIHGGTSVGSP
jgi:alpha-D-xyloside xylohydrolase